MNVKIFNVCEFAGQTKPGSLSMKNTLDTLNIPKIPVVFDHCYVALGVRFPSEEAGEHAVKHSIVDPLSLCGKSSVATPLLFLSLSRVAYHIHIHVQTLLHLPLRFLSESNRVRLSSLRHDE